MKALSEGVSRWPLLPPIDVILAVSSQCESRLWRRHYRVVNGLSTVFAEEDDLTL